MQQPGTQVDNVAKYKGKLKALIFEYPCIGIEYPCN